MGETRPGDHLPRWQLFEGGVAWWSVAPGADVEQKLHFRWAFAYFRHHLLVVLVDRKLRSRKCSTRLLGIIDLLDIDEDGAARSLEEIGTLVLGAFGAERLNDLVAALRQPRASSHGGVPLCQGGR